MEYIFTVELSVKLSGVGRIVLSTFPKGEDFPKLEVKQPIILEKPCGKIIETYIAGFELVNYRKDNGRIPMSIRLPKFLLNEEFPEGTKLYTK